MILNMDLNINNFNSNINIAINFWPIKCTSNNNIFKKCKIINNKVINNKAIILQITFQGLDMVISIGITMKKKDAIKIILENIIEIIIVVINFITITYKEIIMNSINIQQNKKIVIGKDIKNMVSYKMIIMAIWLYNFLKIVENNLKYIICQFT